MAAECALQSGVLFFMNKKRRKTLLKSGLLLGLLLFAGIHYRSFLADAWREIAALSSLQVFLIFLLSFCYQLLEGAVIFFMMKKNVPDYRYKSAARCAFICSFFRFATLGSGGMAAEVAELSKDGAAPARAGGMSMVQYLLHKVVITVYGILGFFCLLARSDSGVKDYRSFLWIATALNAVIAAFLILLCTSRRFAQLCFWAVRKICRGKWEERISFFQEQAEVLQTEAKSLLRRPSGKDFHAERMRSTGSFRQSTGILPMILLLDFAKLTCWYLVPAVVLNKKADAAGLVLLTAAAQMLAGVIPAPAGIGSLEFAFLLLSAKTIGEAEAISAILLLRAAINLIPFIPGLLAYARHRTGCPPMRSQN